MNVSTKTKSGVPYPISVFEDAFSDVTGGQPKLLQRHYKHTGRFAVVDQGAELVGGYTDDELMLARVELPAIIFGDHTKVFKWIDEPFVLGADGVKILQPCERLDKRFAYHFLKTVRLPDDAGYSRHYKFLKRIHVPVPSDKREQERIATILDKADAIRRQRQEALTEIDKLMRATFLDVFGDMRTNSKNWDVRPLELLTETDRPITYGIVQAGPHVDDGIPYIKTSDFTDGEINTEGLARTSPEIASKYERSAVRAGDLVFCIRASVGSVGPVPEILNGANLTQGTALIAPGPDVDPSYLLFALRSEGIQSWIASREKGATFKEITLKTLRETPVPCPPRDLQAKFGSQASKMMHYKGRLAAAAIEADALFDLLSQRAFRGEL